MLNCTAALITIQILLVSLTIHFPGFGTGTGSSGAAVMDWKGTGVEGIGVDGEGTGLTESVIGTDIFESFLFESLDKFWLLRVFADVFSIFRVFGVTESSLLIVIVLDATVSSCDFGTATLEIVTFEFLEASCVCEAVSFEVKVKFAIAGFNPSISVASFPSLLETFISSGLLGCPLIP